MGQRKKHTLSETEKEDLKTICISKGEQNRYSERQEFEEDSSDHSSDMIVIAVEEEMEMERQELERQEFEEDSSDHSSDISVIAAEEEMEMERQELERQEFEEDSSGHSSDMIVIAVEEEMEMKRQELERQEFEEDSSDYSSDISVIAAEEEMEVERQELDAQGFEEDSSDYKNIYEMEAGKIPENSGVNKKMDQTKTNANYSTMDKSSKLNMFEFAVTILKKYRILYLDKNDNILWVFDGKSYTPLDEKNLQALIYQEIPIEEKSTRDSCKKLKENVAEYIKDECYHSVLNQGHRPYCKYFSKDEIQHINGKIVLDNGIYDVTQDKLTEFDPDMPFFYHVHAKFLYGLGEDKLQTPFFDKLLSDATGGDKESIDMIHYVLGMLLLPNKCKKFPVVGPASNSGKSVLFGNFLESLFDGERISKIDPGELGGKFALGNAESKVLISCLDVNMEEISAKAVGTIKRATGEERIKVERKFRDQQDIVVRFKFLFGTNGKFSPARYDAGWANRIIAVPFIIGTPEEKQNPELLHRLWEERDRIVTKVLRKMRYVINSNGMITIPESRLSLELKQKWTFVNTYVEEFFQEMVCVTGENIDISSSDEIYECYCKYASNRANIEKGICSTVPMAQLISSIIQMSGGRIKKKRIRVDGSQNPKRKIMGIRLNKGIL